LIKCRSGPQKLNTGKNKEGRGFEGIETRVTDLAFGSFGLKAMESKWIDEKQLEAVRKIILKYLKKEGKIWFRVFPQKPITSKGVEFSMGGGKGDVVGYVAPVKKGRIIVEIDGIDEETAKEALRKAAAKLPLKTKFVKK
jgi:large subunit ribosomal protein L16